MHGYKKMILWSVKENKHRKGMKGHSRQISNTDRLGMLEHKIETCRIRWKRQDSTGKAFRNNCNLKIASCCNLKVSWVGCFFFGRREKNEEETFLNVFIQQVWTSVARLESSVFPEAGSCGYEKESLKRWSFEWLGDFWSVALRPKNFYRWHCPWYRFANLRLHFQFPTCQCIWDLKYPLHLMFCDNVGMATVQNTLAFMGPPTCCRVNCCLHVANWGQWRAAHFLCELLSHFRIIWNWFRVWLNYGRCRYGLRSLCWAMRWLHTIQAYNIEGCWWQLQLVLWCM